MAHRKGHKAVFGIYESEDSVGNAIDRLRAAAYRSDDISILIPSKEGSPDFVFQKMTKAAKGAVIGVFFGFLTGVFVHFFVTASISVAAMMVILGVVGGLFGSRIPEYVVKRYDELSYGGGILVSVHAADSQRLKKAKEILEVSGAHGISVVREEKVSPNSPKFKSGLPPDHFDPFAKMDNDFRFKF
jgi:hypothetical protein